MTTITRMHKKHELRNYDFCYGMGVNWIDLNNGKMYHIQKYREAIDRGEKPKGIEVTYTNSDKVIEIADPEIVRERMKDPEPDPKY